jgi:polar amino acid transport system substrate-binding protein
MQHLQLVLLVFGLAVSPPASDLAPTGTLRAAFLATNPVQGRVDAKTGAVTGPVADLVRELARRLGVPYAITPVPDAAAVIESITSHKADIGFLAYEAARAAQVDFSDPYALMGSAYAVRADSPIKSSAEVDRAGITIGAARGQSQQVYVSEHIRNARVEVLAQMPAHDALAALLSGGTIDAFAANRQRMEEAAKAAPTLRVLADNFMTVGQAVVVEKGNPARIDEINRFIADVIRSGLVKASIDRAAVGGLDVAPVAKR